MTTNARDEKWSEWIDWSGGSAPLAPRAFVEVKTRDGDIEDGEAVAFYWLHDREPSDIIAYRYKIKEPESDGGWPPEAIKAAAFSTPDEEEAWQDKERSLHDEIKEGFDSMADNVSHPQHYQSDNGIECIDAIRAALGLDGFVAHCRGTAIKYAFRAGKKQAHAEDLRKAAWYLTRAAEALEANQ